MTTNMNQWAVVNKADWSQNQVPDQMDDKQKKVEQPQVIDKQQALNSYIQKKYWNWQALSDSDASALTKAVSQKWIENVNEKISALPKETQDLIKKAAQLRMSKTNETKQEPVQTVKQETVKVQTENPANITERFNKVVTDAWKTKQYADLTNQYKQQWMSSIDAANKAIADMWGWNKPATATVEAKQTVEWWTTWWAAPATTKTSLQWEWTTWTTAWTPAATEAQTWIEWMKASQSKWFRSLAWDYAWLASIDVWNRIAQLPALIDAEQDPSKKAQLLTLYKNDLAIQQQDISQWHITWWWALTKAWQQWLIWSRLDPVAAKMQAAANMLSANAPLIELQKQAIEQEFAWTQANLNREQELKLQEKTQSYDKWKTTFSADQTVNLTRMQFANENAMLDKNLTQQQKLAALEANKSITIAELDNKTKIAEIDKQTQQFAAQYWLQKANDIKNVSIDLQQDPNVQKYESAYSWVNSVAQTIWQAKNKDNPFTDKDWSWVADANLIWALANSMDPNVKIAPWTSISWIFNLLDQSKSPVLNDLQQILVNFNNLKNWTTNKLDENARKQLLVQLSNSFWAVEKAAKSKRDNARSLLTATYWISDKEAEDVTKLIWDWTTRSNISWAVTQAKNSLPQATVDAFKNVIPTLPVSNKQTSWVWALNQ